MTQLQSSSAATAGAPIKLREMLEQCEVRLAETGCYDGVTELTLKAESPLKYESLHTRLRSSVVSARETSKRISASPGVREVGESVVGLYTPEGDSVVFSFGIMVHVHTMSRFIKWMVRNDYQDDPGIRPGDIFANNDAFIGNVQVPDVMDVVPIFYNGELIAWAGAVCHELEVGGVTPGGDVYLAQERFTEGLFVCAEKIGENDQIRRDYLIRVERNLRSPIYWILDEKAKVSACLEVREKVLELVEEIGVDYFKRATKEYIEEGRRAHLERMKVQTVPGRYRGATFFGHLYKNKPGVLPMANKDQLVPIPVDLTIDRNGLMTLDFEGTGPWGWNSNNCCEAAMEGGFFVSLTQFMDFDGKVNDGAWLATRLRLPSGTWTNPDSIMVATACSWALLLPAFGTYHRLMSRAFLARGFKEEIFVGQVNTPFFEGGGISQYGTRFGGSNFELAAGGSGARGIMDGLDTGYAGWNPESDMGNVEIWELSLPILYLGRKIWPDSAGAGRFRGGAGFTSLYKIHHTPMFMLTTAIHSGKVFDNAGMCGGYPAPTALYHYAIRDTNLTELIAAQKPLPHFEGDPHDPDPRRLVQGDFEFSEGGYIGRPFKDGDLFEHFYNAGGGYGDPIERDPELVRKDLENGIVTPRAARQIYHVDAHSDDGRTYNVDVAKTEQLRSEERSQRLAEGVPVSEWRKQERERILNREFVPEVLEMYRDSMQLSSKWMDPRRDLSWDALLNHGKDQPLGLFDTDTPWLLAFTSGSSGRPKGAVHTHGGLPYRVAIELAYNFDLDADGRLLWITDLGWIMGPLTIAGVLSLGASLVMFEGSPDFPDPDRLWELVDRYQITHLGFSPTLVRVLSGYGPEWVDRHDLNSLRILGSTGEPWTASSWRWLHRYVGRGEVPIINWSGGTEIGCGILVGSPVMSMKECRFAGHAPGIAADVFDGEGNSVVGEVGELVLTRPWPSMTRGLWREPERYLETYWSHWSGVWFHGDRAIRYEDGSWELLGRSDDVLKIAGKRLGPVEVESVVISGGEVMMAAAVGIPDPIRGEVVALVIVPSLVTKDSNPDTLAHSVADHVAHALGKPFRPAVVLVVDDIPLSRSGKVHRRAVRAWLTDTDPGDLSTVANLESREAIIAARERLREYYKQLQKTDAPSSESGLNQIGL